MARRRKNMKRKRTKTSESVIECKTNKIASEVIELGSSGDEDIILVDDQQKPSTSTIAEHISPLIQRLDAIFNKIKFVIIQGSHGCGKTYSAKLIAQRRNLPINLLQINEQYDSRILYGSYNCTEVPGEFVWQSSKFAQYIQQPCFILLENLDHGNADLIASIIGLTDHGFSALPNGRIIRMHAECRILGTISLDEHSHSPQLLRDYPYTVNMSPMGIDDLETIIRTTAPDLEKICKKCIEIFVEVSEQICMHKSSLDRELTPKDLFRATTRLNQRGASVANDRIGLFVELFDLWAMHLSSDELRRQVARTIGEKLSLSQEEQHYWADVYKPEVQQLEEYVKIGRTKLGRRKEPLENRETQMNNYFVLTRDSSQLLERIATCIAQSSPEHVLLTGSTGVGKTAVIQQLAQIVRAPLRVVNLNQESEFGDLTGGYKPTSPAIILRPLTDEYFELFRKTFDVEKNAKFLDNLNKCLNNQRFVDFIQLVIKSSLRAVQKFSDDEKRAPWILLLQRAGRLAKSFGSDDETWRRRLIFAYMKGVLTEAAEQGQWLLVDEINLASTECLDALVELIDSSVYSVHPDFRLFACMNNANDVGKRPLPLGLRSQFTEFFISETTEADQLRLIIRGRIPTLNKELTEAILQFYQAIRELFPNKFNFRTLCRALTIAANDHPIDCQRGSLHRSCSIAFINQLGVDQRNRIHSLVEKYFWKPPPLLTTLNKEESNKYVLIEGYKIPRGKEMLQTDDDSYILTPSVKSNIAMLASIVATRHFPVLMEGETSVGKTSIIIQLAKRTGNRVYRINNHEHTDIQEYFGSYAPNAEGHLEFTEGVLLRAVRNGDWIILDELNLAPSPVLEALNRLLDDNRELFIPELNSMVRAHPHFQLFATQNPVGSYSGRKRLSQAFLSRFMVLQWGSIPNLELIQIVHRRCRVSPKMAEMMIAVLEELKARRSISGIFASSDGLMTLRDLFRWGNRMSSSDSTGNREDWRQILADQGYFVLAARCRTSQDELAVVEVLEQQLKRKIDIQHLFGLHSPYMPSGLAPQSHIVFTGQLRRMLILCAQAWRCDEPVLLVGETGCGKTTVVFLFGPHLSINCNEHTDAADLLGCIRPISDGSFIWQDGVVLQAMRQGKHLLIDEISLAADSVLERLNSLLEPQRTILLTDANASGQQNQNDLITAASGFQLVATMNPGNDHGKKELSKALRNRFTEIWCQQEQFHENLLAIVVERLQKGIIDGQIVFDADRVAQLFVKFTEYFSSNFNEILRLSFSIRDLVALAELFMQLLSSGLPLIQALFHSIEANILDALGVLPSRISFNRNEITELCIEQFKILLVELDFSGLTDFRHQLPSARDQSLTLDEKGLIVGPFRINHGNSSIYVPNGFSLNSPTTRRNALRIARAIASNKPIMLEGSPGAGKSSLVVALAAATGHNLVRLNLSEQTDLHDLFGCDIPIPGGPDFKTTSFVWRDGPVLKAIKEGSWILLDEMNLASQSVLEGLNSCFDFRKNIFIGELNRTFSVDATQCKFFACQNPHQQGGNRRALPKSFQNRFISIFIEEMVDDDFIYILCEFCKSRQLSDSKNTFTEDCISKMVLVNKLCREQLQNSQWSSQNGGPFEFNLRDLFRWVEGAEKFGGNIGFGFDLVYLSRLTTKASKEKVISEIYNPVFADHPWMPSFPLLYWTQNQSVLRLGHVPIPIDSQRAPIVDPSHPKLMASQLELLERIAACVTANWLVLLTGPAHSGKRSAIRTLASLIGQPLQHIRLTGETDALDLLGSFEQIQNPMEESVVDDPIELDEQKCITPEKTNSNLSFEWVDSVFVRAYRDGHWLLVEDVNCCSSAVLDCLNSCLEGSDSELVLPSHQSDGTTSVPTVRRHENFRLFFTANPANGQLSRAMRNRAVEIAHCTDQHNSACWSANLCDAITAVFAPNRNYSSIPERDFSTRVVSSEQLQLSGQLYQALQHSNPRLVLSCSAQLPIDNNWFSEKQIFTKGIELALDLLKEEGDKKNKQSVDAMSMPLPLNILGLNFFPPIVRPEASPNVAQPSGLTLYYWRCWNEVSSVARPDVCFQLAFLFPTTTSADIINYLRPKTISLFMTIDELRRNELVQFMIEFMKQEKVQQHSFDLCKKLMTFIFSSHLRIWKNPQKMATNYTENGQNYLAAIRKNKSRCRPFGSITEMNQYDNQWDIYRSKSEVGNTEATIFGRMTRYTDKILWMLHRIFAENSEEALLPWQCQEHGQLFEFTLIGSNEVLHHEGVFNTLFSHLQQSFVTVDINRYLWTKLRYDSQNILRQLCMNELVNIEIDVEHSFLALWELIFMRKKLCKEIKAFWSRNLAQLRIEFQFQGDDLDITKLSAIITQLVNSLHSLTPIPGFIDPPHFFYLRKMYLHEHLQHVDTYLSALQPFLRLTTGSEYNFEQLVTLIESSNFAPTLQSICSLYRQITDGLSKLDSEVMDYYGQPFHQSQEDDRYKYRCCWGEGQEALYERHFRRELLERLTNASVHLGQAINANFGDTHNSVPSSADISSNTNNLLRTISSLKDRFISTNGGSALNDSRHPLVIIYPELLAPYLNVLLLLAISIAELDRKCRQHSVAEKLRHKFNFSQGELCGLNLLLCSTSFYGISNNDNGFHENQAIQKFLQWMTTDKCPLTAQQKLPICLWSISQKRNQQVGLEWLLRHWEGWHEEKARIRPETQLIVIKKAKKRTSLDQDDEENGNEEIEDPDESQIREFLPDFSESTYDDNRGDTEQTQHIINGTLIYNALCQISKALNCEELRPASFDDMPFLPFMQIFDELGLHVTELDDEKINLHHLVELDKLRELLKFSDTPTSKVLNVYRESDPAALLMCLRCLTPLQHRIRQLLAEFPENAPLGTLNCTIDAFLEKAPAGAPLMQHAVHLEKILVRAEEWESISDRVHSIREKMVPLQDLLVNWRRREVQCWDSLISLVRADCTQLAVLAGWPLFKCALDTLKDANQQENTLLLMFLDWMHNANLADFEARLWTGRLLVQCFSILAQNPTGIASRLRSICAHFEQFVPLITEEYLNRYKPIEQEIRDFCRVVRYTDLNVWSVQDSVKRAHTQLSRILRKFKEICNESLSPLLFDKLPRLPKSILLDSAFEDRSLFLPSQPLADSTLSRSINTFVDRLNVSLLHLLGLDLVKSLREDTLSLLNTIQTDIKYDEPPKLNPQKDLDGIQAGNEKRRGKALFERQQRFALLIRAAAHFGLTARKSQHIDSEKLTMQALAEVSSLEKLPQDVGSAFRYTVASRNIFLRKLAVFRRQQQPDLSQQIPPATMEHLRGLTEFTLHWLYNAISAVGKIAETQHRTKLIARCFDMELQSTKKPIGKECPSHTQTSTKFAHDGALLSSWDILVGQIHQLLRICPKRSDSESSLPSLHQFREPLGTLRQPSNEHSELMVELAKLEEMMKCAKQNHKVAEINSVLIENEVKKDGIPLRIWNRDHWNSYVQSLSSFKNAFDVQTNLKLQLYFPDQCSQILLIIDELSKIIPSESPDAFEEPAKSIDPQEMQHIVLLRLQSIYEKIEQYNCNNEGTPLKTDEVPTLDAIKGILEIVARMDIDKVLDQLFDMFTANSFVFTTDKSSSEHIAQGCMLAHGLEYALGHLLQQMNGFIGHLVSFYAHWVAIGCHLLTKGFVNPVPELEKRQKSADERIEEGLGFGESADILPDAEDVSGQVESMEQIEGLRGEQQQEGDPEKEIDKGQQQQLPDVDKPIEMEDDFAGCLEGLDAADEGEDRDEIGDEQQPDENQIDWNFGQVEEPQEKQLDPKLWEPEPEEGQQQQRMEEAEDENQQVLTDELTAKQQSGTEHTEQDVKERDDICEEVDDEATIDGQGQEEEEMERRNKSPMKENNAEGEEFEGIDGQEKQDGEICANEDKAMEEDIDEVNGEEERAEGKREEEQQQQGNEEMEGTVENEEDNENGEGNEEEKESGRRQRTKREDGNKSEQRIEGIRGGEEEVGYEQQGHEQQQEEDNGERETEGGRGRTAETNDNDDDGGDEGEGEARQKKKTKSSSQKSTNEGENEEEREREGEGTENDTEEDGVEIEASNSEKQMSAHAAATHEQALRTRALFDAHLRRLRRKETENSLDLATEANETQESHLEKGEEEEKSEDGTGEQIDKQKANEMRNMEETEEAQKCSVVLDPSRMIAQSQQTQQNLDCLVIDRLCAEFDKLEQSQNPQDKDADARELQLKWALITDSIAPMAAELTESLRAIIEPNIASKLVGDYRTGKRLNMRRLITYIASDYRKDRIWMRRTKKAKRNHQICIAVDNSESMRHNHMTEITCNALCLIDRALRQLELGQVALCSFGSRVQLISDFASDFADSGAEPAGVRILRQLRFDQQRTDLCQLLTFTHSLFCQARERGSSSQAPEQMLIILGDGRGVFTEGVERIRQAQSLLAADRVTVLFLIMDIPATGDGNDTLPPTTKSIVDMRIVDFAGGQCTFRPYMQQFPFPLYALVRDTRSLPATVAEAVRQWFDYTTKG